MRKPKLLDLFCKAGGAAMGYHRAGFEVMGVDIEPQKNYPFAFRLGDALEILKDQDFIQQFDVIHASPPCQAYSICTPVAQKAAHPDLIAPIRQLLKASDKPFVIENVAGARRLLHDAFYLCGTMFGLKIWRHRYFETKPVLFPFLPPCNHSGYPVLITGTTRRALRNGGRFEYSAQQCRESSEIDWMTRKELDEAIPPAYTEYIGKQLLNTIAG